MKASRGKAELTKRKVRLTGSSGRLIGEIKTEFYSIPRLKS